MNIKKLLLIICITVLVLIGLVLVVYNYLVFRLISIDPVNTNSNSSTVVVTFNKKITNTEDVYKNFSSEPSVDIILVVNNNKITITPSSVFEKNTNYKILIPELKSGNKNIKSLEIKFKSGDKIEDNYSTIETINYKNNINHYSFMNNDQDLYRDSFTIHMQDSSSREPSFILTLTPNIQDYSNQESKNKDYIKAFSDFKDYISKYGFNYKDLTLTISPSYIQELVYPDINIGSDDGD